MYEYAAPERLVAFVMRIEYQGRDDVLSIYIYFVNFRLITIAEVFGTKVHNNLEMFFCKSCTYARHG